jgi:hypothetical protein
MFDIDYNTWYFLASERSLMIGLKNRIFQAMVLEWELEVTPTSAHDNFPNFNKDGSPPWRIPTKDEISLFCSSGGDTVQHPARYWCELTSGGGFGTYDPKTFKFHPLNESSGEYGLRLVRTHVSNIAITRKSGLIKGAIIMFS